MGSKTTSQQTQQQSTTPNAAAMSAYNQVLGTAQSLAQTPYQAYTGQLVAPTNSQQNLGQATINNVQQSQQPYIDNASGLAGASLQQVNATPVDANAISQYESPYQSQVINSTMANINNANQQQDQALASQAIGSGAFGGDRNGVAAGNLANQQALATNSTLANLNNQNYTQALGEANNQQEVNLGAAQANRAQYLPAAELQAGLGSQVANTGLASGQAQYGVGTQQQQTSQALDTANYQQYQNQLAFPYQQASWLAGIADATGPNMGSTSYGTSTTQGNSANSILGAGIGLAGLFLNRGGAVKPKMAIGGGLGGAAINDTVGSYPYAMPVDPQFGGYVPSVSLPGTHMQAPSLNMNSGNNNSQAANQNNQITSGLKSLGTAFQNSSLGDSFNDAMQDMGDNLGLARGGKVPRYDDGGNVPDANGLLFDPSALGDYSNVVPFSQSGLAPPQVNTGDIQESPPPPQAVTAPGGLAATVAPVNDNQPAIDQTGPGQPNDLGLSPNAGTPLPGTGYTEPGLGSAKPVAPPVTSGSNGLAAIDKIAPAEDGTFGRMIGLESGGHQFDANGNPLTSPKGAVGISQVMPGTAQEAAKLAGLPWDENLYRTDPKYNLALGKAYYQHHLETFGSPDKAAAAYNAGPGAVYTAIDKARINGGSYLDYLPAETQKYVANATGESPPNTALAYDDNGLGSKPVSSHSSSGLGGADSSTSRGNQGDGQNGPLGGILDGLGIHLPHLSDNMRMALISAGLGIMASPSKSIGQAIGQGGLQGVQAYQAAQKNDRENALLGANLANTRSEIENRTEQRKLQKLSIDQEAQKLQLELRKFNQLQDTGVEAAKIKPQLQPQSSPQPAPNAQTNVPAQQPGSSNPASSSSSAPSAPQAPIAPNQPAQQTASSGQPSQAPSATNEDAAFWSKANPDYDPRRYMAVAAQKEQQAALYMRNGQPQIADTLLKQASDNRTKADAMQGKQVLMQDGTYQYPPSYLRNLAQQKQMEADAGERAKYPTQQFDFNKPFYTEVANAASIANKTRAEAKAIRDTVIDPKTGLVNLNTGPLTDEIASVSSHLEQLGMKTAAQKLNQITGINPNDANAVNKIAADIVGPIARDAMGQGQRISIPEFKNYMRSVPNQEMLPRTIQWLVDKYITPKAEWEMKRFDAIKDSDLHTANIPSALRDYDAKTPLDLSAGSGPSKMEGYAPDQQKKNQNEQPIQVKTVEEARALPHGTKFIDPNGKTRINP